MNEVATASGLKIEFPPELPISARTDDIRQALTEHQVIIVCGETGSGKTTQLPKLMLAMGRGKCECDPGQHGQLIGHTQPRRIAASSVANRIAQELETPLGEVVGYQVRFQSRVQAGASIKLMTDGILLAETQSDPLLQAYDTLIIDEAHERSLNIDFLLGYIRQILPRRPDLKIIITSATIDAERFAEHFADESGSAPVLLVSGRTYPVEQRWRPFEDRADHGLDEAIADAVDELWRGGASGDILVFLPGEREIRSAAKHLRGHLADSRQLQRSEILPLFSRLSAAEQARIFQSHDQRRIVLSTNVAETSLTVPGIRFVIDSGTARVKRYSYRSKVERLLIEPISQAAANQRAGRCGRVANGICIRLYDEQDFHSRPEFTDPEILRSSLAGVILRMKDLGLLRGKRQVQDFPFLEMPSSRAIADGYQLLDELGAIDERLALTRIGHELARLPLDARVGRMLLAGREFGCLREVLVIASALSVPDVRDRPLDKQAQADQQHARFNDPRSELSSYLKLWRWAIEARGGVVAPAKQKRNAGRHRTRTSHAAVLPVQKRMHDSTGGQDSISDTAQEALPSRRLSNRQYEKLLRQHYINVRRLRQWRDVHRQLRMACRQLGWEENTGDAGYDAVHRAVLTGLLGNVGYKLERDSKSKRPAGEYLGARGIKFYPHPGAHLSKRNRPWIMCAELVETSRLFGRGVAEIQPQWLEKIAAHLIKRQVTAPRWEKRSSAAMASEQGTLYGLPVYTGRRVRYAPVDPQGARELMIREGLMEGQWSHPEQLPFLAVNQRLIAQVRKLEHKSRRQDLLVDDELVFAFYDQQIPMDIVDGRGLQKWYRQTSKAQASLLRLSRQELMRHEAAGITTETFPRLIRLGGVDCRTEYLHAPGKPGDGLTVDLPLFVLNRVSAARCEWLVPGMLADKVHALLKSLPQRIRRDFLPLKKHAAELSAKLSEPEVYARGSLVNALLELVRAGSRREVAREDFNLQSMPPHLFMNFRLLGDHGRQLDCGRNLETLKTQWGRQARGAFQALSDLKASAAADSAQGRDSAPETTVAEVEPRDEELPEEAALPSGGRYTEWSFGKLPELLELRQGRQSLVGFPALQDRGDAVSIEVFDELDTARCVHRQGLMRLFALQIRDSLKSMRKNLPAFQATAAAYMSLGPPEELLQQIEAVMLARVFLGEPLPQDATQFAERLKAGRPAVNLVAGEVARLAGDILQNYSLAQHKLREGRNWPEAQADVEQQLAQLMPTRFLQQTPWHVLRHFPRYLQAICLRFDKLRAGKSERDAQCQQDLRPLQQRLWRVMASRRGQGDERLEELRWMLEELRVSLFAQELKTPRPVSIRRYEKLWQKYGIPHNG